MPRRTTLTLAKIELAKIKDVALWGIRGAVFVGLVTTPCLAEIRSVVP